MTKASARSLTKEEWDYLARLAQEQHDKTGATLRELKASRDAALCTPNPFKVGDLVHIYARSQETVPIVKVNRASVMVQHTGSIEWRERVPLHRVRLAEEGQRE